MHRLCSNVILILHIVFHLPLYLHVPQTSLRRTGFVLQVGEYSIFIRANICHRTVGIYICLYYEERVVHANLPQSELTGLLLQSQEGAHSPRTD